MEKVHPLNVNNELDEDYNPRLSERRGAVKVSIKTESMNCYLCASYDETKRCHSCNKLICNECLSNNFCLLCSDNYSIKKFCCFIRKYK